MSSNIVSEQPPDRDIGRFLRQEAPETFPPDPPDDGAGEELPGEEILPDYSETGAES